MSQFPRNYTTDSGDEKLEHLKELLAEAEEMCLVLALEKHLEAQRAARDLERISRETGEQRTTERKTGLSQAAPHSHP
jgi:hypothetical protein